MARRLEFETVGVLERIHCAIELMRIAVVILVFGAASVLLPLRSEADEST